jgi:branched-chain amino acid transport system substrate-binding protein
MRAKSLVFGTLLVATMLMPHAFAHADDLLVGAVYPITGPVAYDGQTELNGAKLAVEEVNAKGGVLGKTLKLDVQDGACNPAQSVSAAEKLIAQTKVASLLGAFCSSSTGAVMEVAKKYGIPLVTGVSTAQDLTKQGNKWFFRATDTSALLGQAFAPAIAKLGAKRVAFLVVNDDWGRAVASSYGEALKKQGSEIVDTEIFSRDDTDLFPYITKIKAQKPDVVISAANTQLAANVTKQLRQLGVTATLMGEGAFTSESYLKLVGSLGKDVIGLVEYVPAIDNAANKAFVKSYKEHYNEEPSKFSAAAYQAVHILADAINRARSTDPEEIRQALLKTDYNGLTGNFKFASNGQAYNFDVYMAKNTDSGPAIVGKGSIPNSE